MESAREIWERALGELQIQVSKPNYDTWLRNSRGISCQNDIFVVGVRNAFAAEWLSKRLYPLVKRTLGDIVGREIDLQFIVSDQDQVQATSLAYASQSDGGGSTKVKTEKFHPKYTLDSFIVGNSNRLAYAAAMEVAENLGRPWCNPLFIYGDTGQGKTHLLHAIGHVATSNGLPASYITAEQFTNEFVIAIKQKQVKDFRSKFESIRMLLFDDIHFISDKKQTQQCFFHIFNELYNNDCQIVVTADRPPKEIALLSNKLRSRLEWCLVIPIEPPDFETRLSILRAKAREAKTPSSDEALQLLAQRVYQNVRQLEGALTYLAAQARLAGSNVTPQMVNSLLTSTAGKENSRVIVAAVADYFNIAPGELIGKNRTKKITLGRQIAMYLMREKGNYSFAEIGKELSHRNHATIIHGCQKISTEMKTNPELRQQLLEIQEKLDSRKVP